MNEDTVNAIELGEYLEHAGFSDEEIDNVLAHFGVKGMRWGVRRDNRANLLVKVGQGKGDGFDKFRASGQTLRAPIDLIKGRGLTGAAARRGERQLARNKRVRDGEASIKDYLVYYGGTKYRDLLPSRNSRKRKDTSFQPAVFLADRVMGNVASVAVASLYQSLTD